MRSFIPILALLAASPSILASPLKAPTPQAPSHPYQHPEHSLNDLFRSALLTEDEDSSLRSMMYSHQQEGFDIDLKEMRLVRFGEGAEEVVWMTELEKIEARARGLKFMDM